MDPVTLEILNTQIAAGAEEMALTLQRTARSLYVKEAVDFGVALVTPAGRLFGTPRDFGTALIDYDMAPTLEALGEPLDAGDVLFTNHPYETAGLVSHTPDLTVICPYHVAGRLVAYGYCFVHSTDVGGRVPSSVSPTNTELFQEGLLIPPVKLIRKGQWNREVLRIYRANVRTPDLNGHDLTAMLAALETGRARVAAMAAQHGAEAFVAAQQALMDYAAEKARAVFRRIPDGTHAFHDFIDNDAVSLIPVRFAVSMTVTDGQVHLDFTASDPQVPSAFNVPTLGRRNAWLTVRLLHYVTTHDPSTPMNGGIFRDVTVALKRGTVLDPVFPAATGLRAASAYRLNDAVTGALARAVPDDMPCPSGGAMVPVVLAEHDRRTGQRNVLVLNSIIVGSGARKGSDGYDGVDGSLSTIRNTPSEKAELEAGADILEYGLNPDSGGPGRWRGGMGLRFTFRVTQGGSAVLARGLERFLFRPWGMAGGRPGANMEVIRNIGTAREVSRCRIDMVQLEEGETVTFLTPGGGGYGDPFLRPVEAARRDYGVAIVNGAVDAAETQVLRSARPLRDRATHAFDFGPEREDWDTLFTLERMARLNAEVFRAQPAVRSERRAALFRQVLPALFDPAAVAARQIGTDSPAAARALDALPEAEGNSGEARRAALAGRSSPSCRGRPAAGTASGQDRGRRDRPARPGQSAARAPGRRAVRARPVPAATRVWRANSAALFGKTMLGTPSGCGIGLDLTTVADQTLSTRGARLPKTFDRCGMCQNHMRSSVEINRELLGLYLSVGDPAPTLDLSALRKRVAALRAEVRASRNPELTESCERFVRLIALRLDQPDLMAEAAPAASAAPLRLMVSGIGRSGTTLIYQQLAKLMLIEGLKVNFRYEPYLWNIRSPGARGNPFGMGQLSSLGIHVHTTVPLFQHEADPLHDSFIDHLLGDPWDEDPTIPADAHLTKVIRGSGRLRSYLARYPDLRIVVCLRNPLDTINSGLGMFSFFGEEFHGNDRARFRAEMEARGERTDHLPEGRNTIEWFGAWWQVFTQETLAVARDFPDRVFSFCYEAFQADSPGMLAALRDFVGLDNEGLQRGLSRPAGPSIKATSLTNHDLGRLAGQIAYYRDEVMVPTLGAEVAGPWADRLVSRYTQGRFSFPIAGSDLGQRAPIQLRGMMLSGRKSRFQEMVGGARHPLKLEEVLAAHAGGQTLADLRAPVADPARLKHGKTFGVVVTCHDNAATIVDAVLSCLQQTLPFDRILVVDDKSSDASCDRLAVLEDLYSSVQVLRLESNLGPSAARDLGIRRLGTDFFTQLDGDDLFWPTKNATEAAAIAGDPETVAFSDILMVTPDRAHLLSTQVYDGAGRDTVFPRLMGRTPQIPRDMTLARSRYFEAGGYDLVANLYEDWDFKLRLAALGGRWRRAGGTEGTVYNRLSPGLSGVDDGRHGRALALIFLRALTRAPLLPDRILPLFDSAIGRFADRHIARSVRALIEAVLRSPDPDLAQIVRQVSGRDSHAAENVVLANRLVALTRSLAREEERT